MVTKTLAIFNRQMDILTGTEEKLFSINEQTGGITISGDGKKLLYVTGTIAYFFEWQKDILHVYDLDTGKTSTVFKSKAGWNPQGIVLIQ